MNQERGKKNRRGVWKNDKGEKVGKGVESQKEEWKRELIEEEKYL